MLKKFFKLCKENTNLIKTISGVIYSILTLILIFNQTIILNNQTKIQSTESQPFFKILESTDNKNESINIYNLASQCHINSISHISFLKTTFEASHYYETILTPIFFYSYSLEVFDNSLIYKIIGINNQHFIPNLLKYSPTLNSYFKRETYIKIDFSDKFGNSKILYFNSNGSPIDLKTGTAIFEIHRKLNKIYLTLYKNPYFYTELITPEVIQDLIKNDILLKEIKKLKNNYPTLKIFND